MAVTYDELNDTNKKVVTDLLSKREAIDAVLADLQTERAEAELVRVQKEQELKTEKNRLTGELRKLRKATLA